jgi:hypothetical protein
MPVPLPPPPTQSTSVLWAGCYPFGPAAPLLWREGVSPQKVDETKVALRELGLKDSLEGE